MTTGVKIGSVGVRVRENVMSEEGVAVT